MQDRRWTDNQLPPTPSEITAEFQQLKRDESEHERDNRVHRAKIETLRDERDQARKERDEAVELLRAIHEVRGTIHCNYSCGKCLRCRMPNIDAFLTRLTSGGAR